MAVQLPRNAQTKAILPTTSNDRAAFRLAREYLLSFADAGVTDEVIDYYVEPPLERLRPDSLNGVYLRVLASA